MKISGKLVILGILAVAFVSAATSWWFRYTATHRTAEFWGPTVTRLIRDASLVELCQLHPFEKRTNLSAGPVALDTTKCIDVSHARGLIHLRNALLEDRSFHWPARLSRSDIAWHWALVFRDLPEGENHLIVFSGDALWVTCPLSERVLSCEPISTGLLTMFDELSSQPTR